MEKITGKPFLKWAGGKTQLLEAIEGLLPKMIHEEEFTYIEPFVGSGAVLFWMLRKFPNLKKAVINDINSDLINTYEIIKRSPKDLIERLKILEIEYHSLQNDAEKKQEYYYHKRRIYNTRETDNVTQASLFIFLNRTCFNGLYRVNRTNHFNVPIGSYKTPTICDSDNILAVSRALQKVEIISADYKETKSFATTSTFFYFDPPYKPLNNTSSFNSYSKDEFGDEEQERLAVFCIELDKCGYKWLLSNSDVKATTANDDFFDEVYAGFTIERVRARRSINANPTKRGELNELLITNYCHKKIESIA